MGYRFHYRLRDKSLTVANRPRSSPIVLFLHGFLGSGEDFEPAIEVLCDQFCCLTLDLPGHGQTIVTGADEQYTMAQTAAAIVDFLDRLPIDQYFLVGYSLGGRLALYLALHFPQRFPKSVVVSASPGLETEADRQTRLQQDEQLAEQLEADFPTFLEQWYRQPLFQSLSCYPGFAQLQQRRSKNRPADLAKSLRFLSTGRQPSLWAALAQHTAPLLLLVGADDHKFSQLNQTMSDRCATAQQAIVPNCGHAPHLEQPEAFARLVRSFFEQPSFQQPAGNCAKELAEELENSPVVGRKLE